MRIKNRTIYPVSSLNLTTNAFRYLHLSSLLLFLSIFSFVFVPYLIADANAENTSVALDWTKVSLELDTGSNNGDIAFNNGSAITPDEAGRMAHEAKTLTVNTTGKHFNVYLSMDASVGNKNILCYDYDPEDVDKNACVHTSMGISPVIEDNDAPAALAGNDWGYALNDGETGFSSAGTYINNSLSGDAVISSTATNAADLALYNAKFAAVPIFGNEDLIWSADTTNMNGFGENIVNGETVTGDQNNQKAIIYGIKVTNELVAGTYGSKILYTAVASASDLDSPSTNIVSALTLGGPTDVTKLYMDIDADGAIIRERNITISLVKHSDAATADANHDGKFTGQELETAKESSVGSCPTVARSLELGDGNLSIGCVLPELGLNEGVDYDFIVEVPITGGLTRKYISYKTTGGNVGAIRYVGLQSKDGNDNYYITTMQGITAGICSMTNAWGTGVGDDATLYNRTGTGQQLATSGSAGLQLGLGTFQLKDIRDNKTYLVRRLADGNCWMVQNLDLDLNEFVGKNDTNGGLTPANTDLEGSGKSYWDPSESMLTYAKTIDPTVTLSNYFNIASLNRLGQEQSLQFQPRGASGSNYGWGSLKNESGETLAADCSNKSQFPDGTTNGSATVNGSVCVENNSRSAIPRSYDNGNGWVLNDGAYIDSSNTGGNGSNGKYIIHSDSGANPTNPNGDNVETQYVGDWYTWYAAAAESGTWEMKTDSTATSATDSICPRGWQLPVNEGGTNNMQKSWRNLLTEKYYNANKTAIDQVSKDVCVAAGGTVADNGRCTKDGSDLASATEWTNSISSTGGSRMLRSYPLSLIFSGNYYWVDGGLGGRGSGGYYWSSTPYAYNNSHSLGFTSTFVSPQGGYNKTYGLTIRCVARGTEVETVEEEEAVACEAGKICYDANGGTGEMEDQSATADSDVMLTAPTYNKLGYAFVGWNTQENGFGTTYQANETITTPSTLSSEGLQLYAKWLPSAGTMQEFGSTQCNNLGLHQTVALTDNRDGKTYAVRKLKDGNCWMVNNLNLELADATSTDGTTAKFTLTDQNTDLNSKSSWDPGASLATKAQNAINNGSPAGSMTSVKTQLQALLGNDSTCEQQFQDADTIGSGCYWASRLSDDGNWTTRSADDNDGANSELPRSYNADNNGYYNWYAATAESGTYNTTSEDASDSICPKGWQLPILGSSSTNKSYHYLLFSKYGLAGGFASDDHRVWETLDVIRQNPISFTLSGYYRYNTGTRDAYGFQAHYWNSTPRDIRQDISYNLFLELRTSSAIANVSSGGIKSIGFTIRCVNRD